MEFFALEKKPVVTLQVKVFIMLFKLKNVLFEYECFMLKLLKRIQRVVRIQNTVDYPF